METDPYISFVATKLQAADAACSGLMAIVDGDDATARDAAMPLLYVAQDTQAHWAKLLRACSA